MGGETLHGMIFDRITLLRGLFPSRTASRAPVARWVRVAETEPECVGDVIRLGGLLALLPRRYEAGAEIPAPIDPIQLARAEGRRELAIELLALMSVSADEFRTLMEN